MVKITQTKNGMLYFREKLATYVVKYHFIEEFEKCENFYHRWVDN